METDIDSLNILVLIVSNPLLFRLQTTVRLLKRLPMNCLPYALSCEILNDSLLRTKF